MRLQVEGYVPCRPDISIDRAGTFVYSVVSETEKSVKTQIYIQIEVVDGRKHITIRSGLLIRNKMGVPLDLKLICPTQERKLPPLGAGKSVAVPVDLTSANIAIRPHGWGCHWSAQQFCWQNYNIVTPNAVATMVFECTSIGAGKDEIFRAVGCVNKDSIPGINSELPSHELTLIPPVVISNLLPIDIQFNVPDTKLHGEIPSGEARGIYHANLTVVFLKSQLLT